MGGSKEGSDDQIAIGQPGLPLRTWIWPGVIMGGLLAALIWFNASTSSQAAASQRACDAASQTPEGSFSECMAAAADQFGREVVNVLLIVPMVITFFVTVRRRRRFRPCPSCGRALRADLPDCPHCGAESRPWTYWKGRWRLTRPNGSEVSFDSEKGRWVES